jgi:hypothetical protein
MKKVFIKDPKEKKESAEEWVESREGFKRLTIDVPLSLHSRLKIASVKNSQTMGDLVREAVSVYLNEKDKS